MNRRNITDIALLVCAGLVLAFLCIPVMLANWRHDTKVKQRKGIIP